MLITSAQSIAGLKGAAAKESAIRSFINNEQKQKISREKLIELLGFNSALDIVAQISKSFPGKDRLHLDIRRLDIQLDDLILEGKVQDKGEFDMLHRSLESLYSKVVLVRSAPPTSLENFFSFALKIKVNRK